jgi:hypothetical protein
VRFLQLEDTRKAGQLSGAETNELTSAVNSLGLLDRKRGAYFYCEKTGAPCNPAQNDCPPGSNCISVPYPPKQK